VESFRTEDEQVEALRRWWDENGRSTVIAIVIALGVGFGWQGWQKYQSDQAAAASDLYQDMLGSLSGEAAAGDPAELAQQIKSAYPGSTYAQFAAMHLAAMAVENADLAGAEAQLRWVLGKATSGSDMARVAQLRLARVVAARGEAEQALAILAEGDSGAYQASYALARGDVYLGQGRRDEAQAAYATAQALVALGGQQGVNLPSLQAKLQSLSSLPAAGEQGDAPANDAGES
tara:strand:- start:979 stop:1677 length:699 start_codon:yes stop_codon:yes gene_type:complete